MPLPSLVEHFARAAGDADLAAVFEQPVADPCRLAGLRVDMGDVGDVDRQFLLDDAAGVAHAGPRGIASLTETMITSPTPAVLRFDPPKTLMHCTRRAPELSATSRLVCIWIMRRLRRFRQRARRTRPRCAAGCEHGQAPAPRR